MSDTTTRYMTVVADPPWPYQDANKSSTTLPSRPTKDGSRRQRGPSQWSYQPMTIEDIMDLPVNEWSASNAHLYLWTTNAFMVEAHNTARSWGFEPKTILTWVKVHQDDPARVSMKTGYYFRGATEHVVFAVRGSLPLQVSEGIPTAFLWPRIGKHSQKPEAFLDLVERVSPAPRLEMFSRRRRMGWSTWGDEVFSEVSDE